MSTRKIPLVSNQVDREEVRIILRELERVLDNTIPGDVVELGCYVGTASLYIQDRLRQAIPSRQFHVYDSFDGLPEKSVHDQSPAGTQFKAGELTASKSAFIKNFRRYNLPLPRIHQGWFKNLTQKEIPEKIAFAFLDGDFYESIKTSLRLISDSLAPGAIVVVDDYQSESLPGAALATNEWLDSHHATLIRIEHSLAIIQMPSLSLANHKRT